MTWQPARLQRAYGVIFTTHDRRSELAEVAVETGEITKRQTRPTAFPRSCFGSEWRSKNRPSLKLSTSVSSSLWEALSCAALVGAAGGRGRPRNEFLNSTKMQGLARTKDYGRGGSTIKP